MEIIVGKSLDQVFRANPRYSYQGHFHLEEPKNEHGRYRKTPPSQTVTSCTSTKVADFLQFGHNVGPLCIECKNYREWLYPNNKNISELIIMANELGAVPLLVHRRIHYTTLTNFLEPAGIIAHESYYQYFPADEQELAEKAKHKRSLGFTDILASEDPHPRTVKFFEQFLPRVVDFMGERWHSNRSALLDYANGEILLPELYSEIGSPAGGKWQDFSQQDESDFHPEDM